MSSLACTQVWRLVVPQIWVVSSARLLILVCRKAKYPAVNGKEGSDVDIVPSSLQLTDGDLLQGTRFGFYAKTKWARNLTCPVVLVSLAGWDGQHQRNLSLPLMSVCFSWVVLWWIALCVPVTHPVGREGRMHDVGLTHLHIPRGLCSLFQCDAFFFPSPAEHKPSDHQFLLSQMISSYLYHLTMYHIFRTTASLLSQNHTGWKEPLEIIKV